jgi:metal-dependent amidase/aminoacylase/carboxypeptidase family protein
MAWFDFFPATRNDNRCNTIVKEAAKANRLEVELSEPIRFGEDFGWFSKGYKVAMFGLGAGTETSPLHNPDYDFPDPLIDTGIRMFTTIIKLILDPTPSPLRT